MKITQNSQKINRSIGRKKQINFKKKSNLLIILGILGFILIIYLGKLIFFKPIDFNFPVLVMSGGDPYIRALMRTISASESNVQNPYNILYGGKHFHDFNRHPNQCIVIVSGPNKENCTTAAGRYQFLTTTWKEKARQYHPERFLKHSYSFTPEYQDLVVYTWLKDHHAWNNDISMLLKNGSIEQVLKILSKTWTSLGYGDEDNLMTPYLPKIYQKLLKEELAQEKKSLNNK